MRYLSLFFLFMVGLTSCMVKDESPISNYKPILMERGILRKSIQFEAPKEVAQAGKIYTYENYLFVVEPYKGVHFFNNTDPSNPITLGFLKVPGAMDIAITNSMLYVDNAVDLVTVDISVIDQPKEVNRQENIFPDLFPPDLNYLPDAYNGDNRPANTIIIEWRKN